MGVSSHWWSVPTKVALSSPIISASSSPLAKSISLWHARTRRSKIRTLSASSASFLLPRAYYWPRRTCPLLSIRSLFRRPHGFTIVSLGRLVATSHRTPSSLMLCLPCCIFTASAAFPRWLPRSHAAKAIVTSQTVANMLSTWAPRKSVPGMWFTCSLPAASLRCRS